MGINFKTITSNHNKQMYKNLIKIATIAILFSQCSAKTDLREL